jgi:luciferase family oxidoreductase group 1
MINESPARLSVLDQSPISAGSTGAQALRNSVDLARLADELGYRRYWVAEHHGTPMLASASPEALIGPIAAATTRIRIGSGGVMLPHYSPLKVAETFSILAGLFPGRIDLAVGRAAGTDPATTYALQRDRRQSPPDDFPDQLAELITYLERSLPRDHPFARLTSLPGRPERPDLWILGSSAQSGVWAGELGLPYAFADFINPTGADIARSYRERAANPNVAIGVWAIAADSDEEAERLGSSIAMSFAMLRQGRPIPVPTPERAMRYLAQHGDPHKGRRRIIGTPEKVRAGIEQVAEEYGADEVIVVTITHDHQARRHSYELIAEAFDLAPATPRAA